MSHFTSHTKSIQAGKIAGKIAKHVGIVASKGAIVAKSKKSAIVGKIGIVAKKVIAYGYGYIPYTSSGGW